MIGRGFKECLEPQFGMCWLGFERVPQSIQWHSTRTQASYSIWEEGMFWKWNCLGERVASFRTLNWQLLYSVTGRYSRVHLYQYGNNLDIDWLLLILSIQYIHFRVWLDLWCNFLSIAEHSFIGIFLSVLQPFSCFFVHNLQVYRGLFYIWIWTIFSRRKMFDHLQVQLYSLIENRNDEVHIFNHSKVIVDLRNLPIFHLICFSLNQFQSNLCIFVLLQKVYQCIKYKHHPIFFGIFPTFLLIFVHDLLDQHIYDSRI